MLFRTGRIFYGLAIAATGLQQFFFKEFFQILFPPLPWHIPGLIYFAWLVAGILLIAGSAIALNLRTHFFALLLAFIFLFFFIICYVPYQLFIGPYSPIHLGLWINPLKEFAYAGGALVIARKIPPAIAVPKASQAGFMDNLSAYGRIPFATTMALFGVSHFYYTDTVQQMVPEWIPMHMFWTYFAGIALIASGIAIILKFQLRLIGNLLGLMIFLWFLMLHIPDAVHNPTVNNGNEVFSAFSALAFSGIALVIANDPT